MAFAWVDKVIFILDLIYFSIWRHSETFASGSSLAVLRFPIRMIQLGEIASPQNSVLRIFPLHYQLPTLYSPVIDVVHPAFLSLYQLVFQSVQFSRSVMSDSL